MNLSNLLDYYYQTKIRKSLDEQFLFLQIIINLLMILKNLKNLKDRKNLKVFQNSQSLLKVYSYKKFSFFI